MFQVSIVVTKTMTKRYHGYFSIAVIRDHDQGNLLKKELGFTVTEGLASMTIMTGSKGAGREAWHWSSS